ncbi:MAG: mannose-1-phosphate guanylyltransferase/mannose-6-phosphate isomerase [Veillonellaceae bacterium]|nr:mannose-1-phosphate guanylyltransferase/mannose-6-phosphate isomerase [Veillonellaceae bacterium]
MKVIILAGGGGTRLFPLSRTSLPKQFLKIDGKRSLLAETVRRFLPMIKANDIVIVTNKNYYHHVQHEMVDIGAKDANILLEPVGRNTAPAITLAVRFCLDELGCDSSEVMFVSPSDHIIRSPETFVLAVKQALQAASTDMIITLGIKPDRPETGYGYIQTGQKYGGGYLVTAFKEKPDKEKAQEYINAGNYYWNSGMFAFNIDCFMVELKLYHPQIFELSQKNIKTLVSDFTQMPDISFDYAIVEKSNRIMTIPLTAYWNDIGSWDAIYDVMEKDSAGNVTSGDCMPLECSNTLMLGRSRLIAGIRLEDLLVVETDDVILVVQKGESQKVKELVTELKKQGRREAKEHSTIYRPWGHHTVLCEGPGYRIRRVMVMPGHGLSLHFHYHRIEHWIVIGGTAKIIIANEDHMVHRNESIFIPEPTKHRLDNPGRLPLEIIEVQNGDYLEEDDIVRFE